MRKYLKRQLLEILDTVAQAELRLGDLCEKEEDEPKMELLAEMQQTMIAIGEAVEKSEGEGVPPVSLIERYCDLLWQCSEAENRGQTVLRLLDGCRREITETMENGVAVKLEAVFLPYKASMWDSLESIWRAAEQDEECNAYVIPIPYYERNDDGTLGAVHDERNEFPEEVPVYDYRAVDLFQLHPDVIYFHNPYDQYNTVTSVHPDYYSKRLRECTDMLVYVPYFCSFVDVEEQFCILPGVLYADRVVVQPGQIREQYKNVYINTVGRRQREYERQTETEDRRYWENLYSQAETKFLGLGSPKFDKVLASEAGEFFLPEEWKEKIYNSAENRKKVILYNTSLTELLRGKQRYLDKMQRVFDYFKERRDAALWWRPHPLIRETLKSMVSEEADKYEKMRENFRAAGYGILDETGELHRAIAFSDAYYGDGGSVFVLYKATGKPILIQNLEVTDEEMRGL